ncbi:MAG TPA: DUF5690 family protein [Gemmataceae bacterium]|nr:DUF5690 family protein [Gemmataceae bacterium]
MADPLAGRASDGLAKGSRNGWTLSAWCAIAAFGAYFCTYAFRKAFTGDAYSEPVLGRFTELTLLVISQGLGYTISKFLGIKVIAEMTPGRRVAWLLGLIAFAETALLFFALTPAPYNCIFFFLNGLPLGIVFGLLLGFLEGRRHTEALTAGLCASFIIGDGVAKMVGRLLMMWHLDKAWMPFVAGLLFVPPMLLFAWMLSRIPAPSPADVASRSERKPMNRADRRDFFLRYATGLTLLVFVYLLLTVLRSVRSDFGLAIWQGLGIDNAPQDFVISEMAVGIAAPLVAGLAVCIRDNRRAFFTSMTLAIVGFFLIGAALVGLSAGALAPIPFMILQGLGLYLPYVVFHTTLFERLIAMTRDRGNIGYLMYLADAIGYLGYAAVMLTHNVFEPSENFLHFFVPLSWVIAIASVLLLVPCWWYFAIHPATRSVADELTSAPLLLGKEEA